MAARQQFAIVGRASSGISPLRWQPPTVYDHRSERFLAGNYPLQCELEVPLIEGSNSAHVDLFDLRHARHVLTEFGRSYGCLPAAGLSLEPHHQAFLEQAIQQIASDGGVMPVRLALFADMMKGQEWHLDTLQKLGGERGIGVAFLNQKFSSSLALRLAIAVIARPPRPCSCAVARTRHPAQGSRPHTLGVETSQWIGGARRLLQRAYGHPRLAATLDHADGRHGICGFGGA